MIILSAAAINISLLLPVPFLPSMLAQECIDLFFNGLIISSFSLSFIFSPFLLANYLLPSLGKVNTFVLAAILQGIGTLLFAILDMIPSKLGFVVVAMITRIV